MIFVFYFFNIFIYLYIFLLNNLTFCLFRYMVVIEHLMQILVFSNIFFFTFSLTFFSVNRSGNADANNFKDFVLFPFYFSICVKWVPWRQSLANTSNINIFSSVPCRGRDRMVVGFTITYVISAHHHYSCEFESRSWRGVLDTTLCHKVCL